MKNEVKSFCIIAMDNIKGLDEDLTSIALEPIKLLVGPKQLAMVATFKSDLDVNRIKDVLNIGSSRSFFISEMNSKTFSAHIDDPDIQQMMFPDLVELTDNAETILVDEYGVPEVYDETFLANINKNEREALIDTLLNNAKNLTDNQKKVLNFLASI